MSDFSLFFVILGTFFYLLGFIPYIYHIFYSRVVPHPFSWTIWCILSGVNTIALMGSTGIEPTSITPLVRTIALSIGAIIGWILIRRIRITLFDYVCLSLALLCIYIAYRYGVNQAIIPTILVDLLVLAPTLHKIWNDPESEDPFAWICVVFSQMCILLSLSTHTLENSLFWAYIMIQNALVAFFIYRRKIFIKNWKYRIHSFLEKWISSIKKSK
jgi:hypothetical protein